MKTTASQERIYSKANGKKRPLGVTVYVRMSYVSFMKGLCIVRRAFTQFVNVR